MIDLTVKTLDSRNHAFSLEDDQITVRGFKEYIADSVAVPADSQRLIYCGRVLQDEKKLNDYDVNGKVIHLVQRAPPQPGQRGNDGGQSQSQNQGSQGWQNLQRAHYRFTRAQMHGNAMYLGAMSVPAEVVEGHGLALPQYSNRLSSGRLIIGGHMLERTNRLMDRLENPSRPVNPSSSENNRPGLGDLMQESEVEPEQLNNDGRTNGGARLTEAVAAAIASAVEARHTFLLRGNNDVNAGNNDENAEARPAGDTNEDNQSDSQQPQQPQTEQQGSTSNNGGQSNRRSSSQPPGPPQLAEFLELLRDTQSRLHPHIERYCKLMRDDPSLPPGRRVEETQTYVDGVSECLHYMSHACHALSDIIVDMSQQPPRNLQCRPIVIQHSAILQPGIPIQVEAHISLHGRNANNNNGTEENGDAANNASQAESTEGNAEDSNQQPESEATAQQQTEQQEHAHSPFDTVFNLPNNVEVLMEVSPEGNLDAASGSEQTQTGENNNNNNNNNNNVGGRVGGTAGAFSWGSAPTPDFIRNLMQAVAGHMVQSGMTNTTITTRNPVTVGQQNVTSMDSGNTNAGQSTQARSNVGTHPTTATQTRSTPRPHVFHQQTHPLGVGMSIRQIVDFDPFLQCNSHHFRPTSATNSNTVTSTSQSTQTSQTTSETQSQAQTATTSSATSNTSSTNTIASITLPQQILGGRSGQPQAGVSINSNDPELAESLGNIVQLISGGNIVEDSGSAIGGNLSFLDVLERVGTEMYPSLSQDSGGEGNFLLNLIQSMVQRMTLENFINLRIGRWEPICDLREPLQEFLRYYFPNTTTEALQEQATERLLSQLRPHLQNLLASEEDASVRNGSRIDICATVEVIFRRHIVDILQRLFDNDLSDPLFGQEVLKIVNNFVRQLCAVLRYSIRGGQSGLELLASRFMNEILGNARPALRRWMLNAFATQFRNYSLQVTQPPESEILPLLIYKDAPSQPTTVSSAPTHQSSQPPPEVEPMETEAVEERTNFETSLPNDGEEVPETFPGHEALPSDWVPIIARDGVRQRRQLQMQGMNGGVATFSDAYLGTLPTKRRKLIEQQKPRLLVSPTPNHSAIAASMERLVREGVTRAGVDEVEGAAVAVAVDPGVRHAFGQAIRDCLNPRRYGTPDFPDPLRFPNATKYFSDQDRPPK